MSLIALEGIDAAGKTTVLKHIREQLNTQNKSYTTVDQHGFNHTADIVFTTEPDDTSWLGKEVRKSISMGSDSHPLETFFLFLADHINHNNRVIFPALQNNQTIITDRYIGSRIAYQSSSIDEFITGNTREFIETLQFNDFSIETPNPIHTEGQKTIGNHEDSIATEFFYGLSQNIDELDLPLEHPSDIPYLTIHENSNPSWNTLPEKVLYLDITARESLRRKNDSDEQKEVFEVSDTLKIARKTYTELVEAYPRYHLINGNPDVNSEEESKQYVKTEVSSVLNLF